MPIHPNFEFPGRAERADRDFYFGDPSLASSISACVEVVIENKMAPVP